MELKPNHVYVGNRNARLVRYIGKCHEEWQGSQYHYPTLYKFEYVVPDKYVSGYTQTIDQVEKEEYKLLETATILYGK